MPTWSLILLGWLLLGAGVNGITSTKNEPWYSQLSTVIFWPAYVF
ncbi:MAG: hypothetical protein V4690_01455 [Patescibacteria group bacterium]